MTLLNSRPISLLAAGNNLKGQLPTEIGDLIELEHISLFKNQISGTLPSRMRSMVELNFLAIESNMLSGPLPTWINKLGKLQYLDLGDNALSGVLPSFKGMNVLEEVAFDGNHLSGNIDALNDATGLRLLYLGQNNFTGRIHDDTFPALTKLEILDIGDNKFTGYFPAHFYNLNELDMHNNSLTDHGLPTVNTKSSPMTFLSLYGSGIPGTIPSTLGQLSKLEHLDLSENKITGTMSTQFDTLTNLKSLYLSANNFTAGPIPDLWSCTQLQELSMAKTKRNGYIRMWIGNYLKELVLLDLHDNLLTGSIPETLGKLEKLKVLFLNRNTLNGTIPQQLENLTSIGKSSDVPMCHPMNMHHSYMSFLRT